MKWFRFVLFLLGAIYLVMGAFNELELRFFVYGAILWILVLFVDIVDLNKNIVTLNKRIDELEVK